MMTVDRNTNIKLRECVTASSNMTYEFILIYNNNTNSEAKSKW